MAPLIRSKGARRRGATFVQVAVASSVGVIGLGLAGVAMTRAQTTARDSVERTALERRRARGIDGLLEAIQDAGQTTIANDLSAGAAASSITFRPKSGFASDAATFGDTTTIAWALDPAEKENGSDDDRDGLVDEGVVQMTTGTGGAARTTVLIRDVANRLEGEKVDTRDNNGNGIVDERGLCFVRTGNRIRVWLSVAGVVHGGTTSVRTMGGAVDVSD